MTSLGELVGELLSARMEAEAAVRPVIAKTAVEVKNRLAREASGHRHAPALPSSISFDLTHGGLGFECGPDKSGPGSLANLYYFGSSHMNAQLPDPVIALRDEADKAAAFMAIAALGVLK